MTGIKLKHGGAFHNAGTITGYDYGVEIYGGTGTVTNRGSITATAKDGVGVLLEDGGSLIDESGGSIAGAYGASLQDGGSVSNAVHATISGVDYGVRITGGVGTVTNSGSIAASKFNGVNLGDGGSVTNSARGTIGGADNAIVISGGAGHVTNAGTCSNRVYLQAGGTVTNTGAISTDSQFAAVYIEGGSGKITNSGTMIGDAALGSGGTIVNSAGATISGTDAGGWLGGGGVLSNAKNATITGKSGVYASRGAASVTNSGSITGKTYVAFNTSFFGDGVSLNAGGSVTNEAGGTIKGVRYGVYVRDGAGTVTNAGTITGATTAIEFAGSGANTLTLETGSVLNGSVVGSTAAGATNALVLEGVGTANDAFLNFDTLLIRASGSWRLGGVSAIAATTVSTGTLAVAGALTTAISEAAAAVLSVAKGATLTLNGASTLSGKTTNSGTVKETGSVTLGDTRGDVAVLANAAKGTWDVTDMSGIALGHSAASSISNLGLFEKTGAGVSEIAPAFANNGKALVSAGTLDLERAVTGTGTDTISGAATLEIDASVAKTQTIDFTGADGVLDLGSPTRFLAVLSGFDKVGSNDAVELLGSWSISGFASTSTQSALTLKDGTESASLVFDGSYKETLFVPKVVLGHTTITYT